MKTVFLTAVALALAFNVLSAQAPAVELKVGDPAPNFTLKGTDGKTYTLADFKGKKAVVVAWFPKAFTQGCTIECKSLAENGHLIKQYDVAYFMASVDPIEQNTKFGAEHKADFPLLSDPDKTVATAYGVLSDRGVANRWTFYIGKDGRILAIDKAVKPATSAEDMAAKLKELGVASATSR
ncbi:MAG TPA: peroxiredoxin [Vicinamibacterales bacterium]|nr:peroxiredoxin [Vicinamibacterales bacterium]